MFAMLCGPWPRATADGTRLADVEAAGRGSVGEATVEQVIERATAEAIAAQVDAGMELITDGAVRWADPEGAVLAAIGGGDTGPRGMILRSWRMAAALSDRPLAQVVPGPWTLAVRATRLEARPDTRPDRLEAGPDQPERPEVIANRALQLAVVLAGEVAALGEAGCPVVQVMEPAAAEIGEGTVARDGFRRAHDRLLRGAGELHVMLAITGGSAAGAGAATILEAPYASFLFDLVAGPDNWHLVRSVPGDRGVVCAALQAGDGRERQNQAPQLVWAAHYAASSNGRGLARVGLANASPLDTLQPAEAAAALRAVADAARLATLPPGEAIREGLDPKAFVRGDRLQALARAGIKRRDDEPPPDGDR